MDTLWTIVLIVYVCGVMFHVASILTWNHQQARRRRMSVLELVTWSLLWPVVDLLFAVLMGLAKTVRG